MDISGIKEVEEPEESERIQLNKENNLFNKNSDL